jgi:hypothetical protein
MDAAVEPGQGIGRTVAAGESAERQIDAFIQKRHNNCVRDWVSMSSLRTGRLTWGGT